MMNEKMATLIEIINETEDFLPTIGADDKRRQSETTNAWIDAEQLVLMAVVEVTSSFSEHLERAGRWRAAVLALPALHAGLGVILGDVLSQSGYLFNHEPHSKEVEYIQVCRKSSDLLNPLSAISYNLFLGDPPDEDLPTKFDKRLAKDVEAILALLENPEKGIAAAEKMWDRRKNANMHRWYGTGPAHDYLLDALILCILKYHKADFESDSIHMKGYRFLAANGFGMSGNVRHD